MKDLCYSRTNESIAAAVIGLDLKPNDKVYSVGGSGDMPFAFLEYVMEVTAIDANPEQVRLMKKRREALDLANIEGFLEVTKEGSADNALYCESHPELGNYNLNRRNTYFRSFDTDGKNRRFYRICDNAENMRIISGDFFEGLDFIEPVSKIYLSNIERIAADLTLKEGLVKLRSKLKSEGLLYSANGLDFFNEAFLSRGSVFSEEDESMLERSIEVDQELTHLARVIEANTFKPKNDIDNRGLWNPTVFRLRRI